LSPKVAPFISGGRASPCVIRATPWFLDARNETTPDAFAALPAIYVDEAFNVVATALTDSNGAYTSLKVEPDTYVLLGGEVVSSRMPR